MGLDDEQPQNVDVAALAPTDPDPFRRPVRTARLEGAKKPFVIAESATEAERAGVASLLDLAALNAFSFRFELTRWGRAGWRADGRVSATATQTCGVTLEPVPAEIDSAVVRRWAPSEQLERMIDVSVDLSVDAGDGAEDDAGEEEEPEALGDAIDFGVVATEALALALDPYPRAPGAERLDASAAPSGADAGGEDAAEPHPFAALEALKGRLTRSDE